MQQPQQPNRHEIQAPFFVKFFPHGELLFFLSFYVFNSTAMAFELMTRVRFGERYLRGSHFSNTLIAWVIPYLSIEASRGTIWDTGTDGITTMFGYFIFMWVLQGAGITGRKLTNRYGNVHSFDFGRNIITYFIPPLRNSYAFYSTIEPLCIAGFGAWIYAQDPVVGGWCIFGGVCVLMRNNLMLNFQRQRVQAIRDAHHEREWIQEQLALGQPNRQPSQHSYRTGRGRRNAPIAVTTMASSDSSPRRLRRRRNQPPPSTIADTVRDVIG